MSKLLDLLAQQKRLEAEIENLKSNADEAKVIDFVDQLEALRTDFAYSVPDFIAVVHSYYEIKSPAKTGKSVSENAPKAPKEPSTKYKVVIDGVEFILKKSKQGIASKAMKDKGFKTYSLFLADLMKKNEVENFDALINKLDGVEI